MVHFLVSPPDSLRFEVATERPQIVIGRSSQADISVPDPSLSRSHAVLVLEGDSWTVKDLGSRNGTRVNGDLIAEETPLSFGDVISVGDTTIVLKDPAKPRSTDPESDPLFRPAEEFLAVQSTDDGIDDIAHLREMAQRLTVLNEVHQALTEPISLGELLDLILDRIFVHLDPERGAIFLSDRSGVLSNAASRSMQQHELASLQSSHLVEVVIGKRQVVLANDTFLDDRSRDADSLLDAGVRSLVAAPMLGPDEPLGMIVLSSSAEHRAFTEDDMELLASLASIAAMRVQNLQLIESESRHRRQRLEIGLARRIQVALLPSVLPTIPGYAIHAGNRPSAGVSGDYYEVLSRNNGAEVLMMVVDVSGAGIGASLLMGALESLSAAPIENGWPPEAICATVSRLLYERTPPEKFATAILGVLEPALGFFRFTNAGHFPGLVIREDGTTTQLHSTGLPLGLFPDTNFALSETFIDRGDTLVLYTDGITESENDRGEQYGLDRLVNLCLEHRRTKPSDIAQALETALMHFNGDVPPGDDRTLVILKRDL